MKVRTPFRIIIPGGSEKKRPFSVYEYEATAFYVFDTVEKCLPLIEKLFLKTATDVPEEKDIDELRRIKEDLESLTITFRDALAAIPVTSVVGRGVFFSFIDSKKYTILSELVAGCIEVIDTKLSEMHHQV